MGHNEAVHVKVFVPYRLQLTGYFRHERLICFEKSEFCATIQQRNKDLAYAETLTSESDTAYLLLSCIPCHPFS